MARRLILVVGLLWGVVVLPGWAQAPTESVGGRRAISPMEALLRSTVLPGLGQWSIDRPVKGTVFLTTTLACLGGWLFFHRSYRTLYTEEYLPAVERYGLNSDQAESWYRQVNSRFKVSRGLLFTALGVWMFSMVDAYVDAAFRNASLEAETIRADRDQIERLNIQPLSDGSAVFYQRRF